MDTAARRPSIDVGGAALNSARLSCMTTLDPSACKAGAGLDDLCRACKSVRRHTVLATPAPGAPLRVRCDYCGSEHNYRGGERDRSVQPSSGGAPPGPAPPLTNEGERSLPPMDAHDQGTASDLEALLRRVIREECGLTPAPPADKWRGGELVLRPGKPGLQEKSWPIDGFFHKVVMLRNRLRVLEQQVNAAEIPEDLKVKLQGYVTACYGTLTSFNVLFADESDRFRGAGGED